MICRKFLSVVVATVIVLDQFGFSLALAEARYTKPGFIIDAELWLEDAEIDPISYFVIANGNKHLVWSSEDDVLDFFDVFNTLVQQGILDELDVQIVWRMRFAPTNDELIYELGINRNTFFGRLKKIRREMREAFEAY